MFTFFDVEIPFVYPVEIPSSRLGCIMEKAESSGLFWLLLEREYRPVSRGREMPESEQERTFSFAHRVDNGQTVNR